MGEKLLQHKHCRNCGRAVQVDQDYCNDRCREEHHAMLRKKRNQLYVLMILALGLMSLTMVLGGLWHGANYRFLIWGFLHGAGLAFDKLLGLPRWLKNNPPRWQRLLMTLLTFHFVLFLWIFFRAQSLENATAMLWQITHHTSFAAFLPLVTAWGAVIPVIFAGFLVHWLPAQWQENIRGAFIRMPMVVKLLIVVLVVFFLIQVKGAGFRPFIYFRF